MDFTVLDVTDCLAQGGRVDVGDWVECFGLNVSVDEAAAWAGTIAFEMFTGIGNRVSRHYVGATGTAPGRGDDADPGRLPRR